MQKLTLGIDEVGRGSWAGPLVVAAVALSQDTVIDDLNDSKKLSRKQRERLTREIQTHAAGIGIGWVDAKIVDEIGLSKSLYLATERAFSQLPSSVSDRINEIIIDGTIKLLDDPRAVTMVKADGRIKSVSAASIVAKVARDHYMDKLCSAFPGYDFSAHVGYGTAKHAAELEQNGPISGIHRFSFTPVSKAVGINSHQKVDKVSSTIGRLAENAAADFLVSKGHQIIAQNWKTKICEIDIISSSGQNIYFSEVKYRSNPTRGNGLSAITPKKLKQMQLAANFYLSTNKTFDMLNPQLSAISMSGEPPTVNDFLENIS